MPIPKRFPGIQVAETVSEPQEVSGKTITLVERVRQIRWPGFMQIKRTPVALAVHEEGEKRLLPLFRREPILIASLTIVLFALATGITQIMIRRRQYVSHS